MKRALVRDRIWSVQDIIDGQSGIKVINLYDPREGEKLRIQSPPEEFEILPDEAPGFSREVLSPLKPWQEAHAALELSSIPEGEFAAFHSGRISPEHYQFAPVQKLLQLPKPSLLIADDVGLGKTIEAGICMLELIARGIAKRILLVVPPGLIPQWQDEMVEKFGLHFESIENAAALERIQTRLAEGIKPWIFLNRIITSVEYLKKREVLRGALEPGWDLVIVDEAHYLAESGTPRNPYLTARARLGQALREKARGLMLLTATPHNGYGHSFRSLLELVEPTDATFGGDEKVKVRRISRSIIRRLKQQIWKSCADGKKSAAFAIREPVQQILIDGLSDNEKSIFKKVSNYCARIADEAASREDAELVSFAMQIIKKRMLSSRAALTKTIESRLAVLSGREEVEEPPARSDVRELQGDLPLREADHERIADRILRSAITKDEKRRNAEKRQLQEIKKLLKLVEQRPDPKINALVHDLEANVLSIPDEKAIIFTEYLDTLGSIRSAFESHPRLKEAAVELTGGLSPRQRQQRIAAFEAPEKRVLLATDAASEGLNLQRLCRRVYHFELPWNPNRMEQRNGRVDRYGQTRSPIIRYLIYKDSPEDLVLDRLVQRIVQMHDDKVSTPDILGILEGSRLDDILVRLDAESPSEAADRGLLKIFEERCGEFRKEVAPLITGGNDSYGKPLAPSNFSADPVLHDDENLEQLMLGVLGSHLRPAAIPNCYALRTPRELQGSGVQEQYHCLTFRRSVAIRYLSKDVEFINRLHPLFRALAENAYQRLSGSHSSRAPSRRLAARRHPYAEKAPYAVFTYASKAGAVLGSKLLHVAMSPSGDVLPELSEKAISDRVSPPGEVPWEEVAKIFQKNFDSLQKKTHAEATRRLRAEVELAWKGRQEFGKILREDAERYKADRLAEIDLQEREARRTEEGQQLLMEEREVYGYKSKRAAIETFHRKRLEEISEFEKATDTIVPQPLGVLFVFPVQSS